MASIGESTSLSQHYEALLRSVQVAGLAEGEEQPALRLDQNQLDELRGLWSAGQLGRQTPSLHHGSITIRDFGQWNRSAGADFLRVELEIDGQWRLGSAHLTYHADDWEKQACHQSEHFADTILHICLKQGEETKRSRTCTHQEVACICIPEEVWQGALGLSPKLNESSLVTCHQPLEECSREHAKQLLLAAAAYRIARKRTRFTARVKSLGKSQAWYEAWAEALGYYSNRHQMKLLARRAPISELSPDNAEAILFGTAGFLRPVLPDKALGEDRNYHRLTWDIWWPLREQFGLSPERCPQWKLAGQRPMNHPNRRVAALAETVKHWGEFEPLLCANKLAELEQFRLSLSHPYWNYHSALPSPRSPRAAALVGQERLRAFLINHLLVNDDSPLAWQLYLKQKERSLSSSIKRASESLFGTRPDLEHLLPYCYVQQGLIQIQQDFMVRQGRQARVSYPQELSTW